jgi:hypothetical protein
MGIHPASTRAPAHSPSHGTQGGKEKRGQHQVMRQIALMNRWGGCVHFLLMNADRLNSRSKLKLDSAAHPIRCCWPRPVVFNTHVSRRSEDDAAGRDEGDW